MMIRDKNYFHSLECLSVNKFSTIQQILQWPKNLPSHVIRKRLIERYAKKRQEIKAKLEDPELELEEFISLQHKLTKLPKNSSPIRYRKRCSITGRPRGYIGKFGVSRITFRELSLDGKIPGITKSSW